MLSFSWMARDRLREGKEGASLPISCEKHVRGPQVCSGHFLKLSHCEFQFFAGLFCSR